MTYRQTPSRKKDDLQYRYAAKVQCNREKVALSAFQTFEWTGEWRTVKLTMLDNRRKNHNLATGHRWALHDAVCLTTSTKLICEILIQHILLFRPKYIQWWRSEDLLFRPKYNTVVKGWGPLIQTEVQYSGEGVRTSYSDRSIIQRWRGEDRLN